MEGTDGLDQDHISLMANAERTEDMVVAMQAGALGIGLFRTEFAFMERRQFPTEEEQVSMYRTAVERPTKIKEGVEETEMVPSPSSPPPPAQHASSVSSPPWETSLASAGATSIIAAFKLRL